MASSLQPTVSKNEVSQRDDDLKIIVFLADLAVLISHEINVWNLITM